MKSLGFYLAAKQSLVRMRPCAESWLGDDAFVPSMKVTNSCSRKVEGAQRNPGVERRGCSKNSQYCGMEGSDLYMSGIVG